MRVMATLRVYGTMRGMAMVYGIIRERAMRVYGTTREMATWVYVTMMGSTMVVYGIMRATRV